MEVTNWTKQIKGTKGQKGQMETNMDKRDKHDVDFAHRSPPGGLISTYLKVRSGKEI